jgi:hypothetical protein
MSRWKAAAIHLALSVLVIAFVAVTLVWVFYGREYFAQLGGARLLMVLAIIDVTIGPLLTLVVYKHGKKSLRFDLSVIALLQVGFLAYGLHIMAQSRPVFLVAVLDRFEMVFANELADDDLAKGARPEYSTRSWSGPRLVGGEVLLPGSPGYREIAIEGLMGGRDIQHMPERYVPFEQVQAGLLEASQPVSELEQVSSDAAARVRARLERLGRTIEEVRFVPVTSSRGRAAMLLDAENGAVLGPIAIDPWAAETATTDATRH